MSNRKIRDLRFYLEYEYDSYTKDMIEDLLEVFSSSDEILSKAIEKLHEEHFGSISKRTHGTRYSDKVKTAGKESSEKLDELEVFIQNLKEQGIYLVQPNQDSNKEAAKLTEEANKRIISKIDELGMKFTKILTEEDQKGKQKTITAEMSQEEILQLIKRIDQLESKLTRAISQSRVATAPTTSARRGGMRDMGEPPSISVKKIDGPIEDKIDRPLLDDVLDTVIVSVEDDQ